MKKIDLNDAETKSPDLVAANLEALRALFPELVTEGPDGVAVNLEVLKLLQKSYAGKVKLIYIDPPYNTGKDFVYPDNFQDNIKNYLELTGQTGEGGKKLSSNTEASGRFHTDWLNMMYPRLKLARNLLREDGVILISIDDAEIANVRRIADEVFGEENFMAVLVWDRNRKNDAKYFSVGHEYMVGYFKNESLLAANQIIFRGQKDGVEEVKAEFERLRKETGSDWVQVRQGLLAFYAQFTENDPRAPLSRFTKVDEKGPYRDDGNINWPGGDGPRYEVLHPNTKKPCKLPTSGWRYPNPARFWEEVGTGRIVFGPDETTVPRVRTNLFENSDQVMVSVHYSYAQTAANQFNSMFDGKRVFDNPKPVDDLRRLVAYLSGPDDLIRDFFAGSGTTGHGVFLQNAADNGQRRFVLVQLPELLDVANKDQKVAAEFCNELHKPLNIAEITKERLRRAGKKVKEENPLFPSDIGFRVFKLASSNIRAWEPDRDKLAETLLDSVEHLKTDRTEQDILFELLLKLGLDLCVPIETRILNHETREKGKKQGSETPANPSSKTFRVFSVFRGSPFDAPRSSHSIHSIGGGSLLVSLSNAIPPWSRWPHLYPHFCLILALCERYTNGCLV